MVRVFAAHAAFAAAVAVSSFAAAETVGPVTDPIGVVKIAKGQPVVVGGYWPLNGPDGALGLDQKRGVELAIQDAKGTFDGHPIRLEAEDSQCSVEGGQTAAAKLATNPQVLAVIGPACSSEARGGAPILWQSGIPSIGTSATAPTLTAPNRGPGFEGFLRTVHSDNAAAPVIAKYVREVLKADKVATIHDGTPYPEQVVRAFEEQFTMLGGQVVAREAVAPTDSDMRPVLTRVATAQPQVIFMPVFVNAAAFLVRQAKEVPGLQKTTLLGTDAVLSPNFLEAAGDAAVGYTIAGTDTSPQALGPRYVALLEKYKAKYGEDPLAAFHPQGYDAGGVLLAALKKVAVKGDDGSLYVGRKALRDALYATKDYEGVTGTLTCSPTGDCGQAKFHILEFVDGSLDSYKVGVNPKVIWP